MSELVVYEIMLDFKQLGVENIEIDYPLLDCDWAERVNLYEELDEEDE
jgi:hypothetical protein